MPFPWKKKKNRVTRISQFVADFQSPQRTSSLVVQTGFPTSLIDLFAKNRNRFKNSTFTKPVRSEIVDPPPPPPPPPSPVTTPPSVSESPIHEVFSEEILNPVIGENTDDGAGDVAPVNKRRSSFRSKSIIVKILTVIILAASAKELTVAITVSAFALLFLENALKRVVSFLKPCLNVFVSIESLFQKIPFHLKSKSVPVTVLDDGEIELLNLNSNCCVNDEIEVVEEKSELGICHGELEDSSTKEIVEEKYLKERIQFRSRSGRFKATMVKKLHKFRSFKKEKKEEEKGNHNSNVRLNASNNKDNEIESCSDVSSVLCEEDKEEVKNEIDCGINCSREESIIVVGNSSYAILMIIALIGLIVGRLQALFLTIGWCLLVKMVRSIWRSKNGSSLDGVKLGGLDH